MNWRMYKHGNGVTVANTERTGMVCRGRMNRDHEAFLQVYDTHIFSDTRVVVQASQAWILFSHGSPVFLAHSWPSGF